MKIFVVMVSAALSVLLLQAGERECYEYPSEAVALLHETVKNFPDGHFKDSKAKVDPVTYRLLLVVPEKTGELNWRYIYLLKRKNDEEVSWQSFECKAKKDSAKGYLCQGECDAGSLDLDSYYNIISMPYGITLGDSIDAPEGTWDVDLVKKGRLVRAKKIPCPKSVLRDDLQDGAITGNYTEEPGSRDHIKGRFVCYVEKSIKNIDGKTQTQYSGCQIHEESCEAMGLMHFGHYPSNSATIGALERCLKSKPKE